MLGGDDIRQIVRLTRNLTILTSGEVLARGLTFVAFAHLARTIEPEGFGYVESALAVTMFATLLVDLGFGTVGARDIARKPSIAASLAGRVVSARLLLALGVVAVQVLAALLLPLDETLSILMLGLTVSLAALPFQLNWVFQGRSEMFWYAAPPVLRQGVFLAMALLVVRSPDDVTLLPWAEGTAAIAMAILYVVVFRVRVGPLQIRPRSGADRELFGESLPVGGSLLIWSLRMFVPVLFVGALIGPAAAGLFATGHRIVMVYQAGLHVYFANLLPSMSQRAKDPPRLLALARRALALVLAPAAALAVVSIWAAPEVLRFVFGDDYVNDASVRSLIILTWLVPVLAARRAARFPLIARGRQRAELACSALGLALLLGSIVPLTSALGIEGASLAMLSSELVATVTSWWVLVRSVRTAASDGDVPGRSTGGRG